MPRITRRMVEDYLASFAWFREINRQAYLHTALDRFTHTLNLIPRLPNPEQVRVLEIGGLPYFMTVLIKKFFGYDVSVIDEPARDQGEGNNFQTLTSDTGDSYRIGYQVANIERDRWPYADDSFDLVIYCEVIEHLIYNPTHTLAEAHRVLKKDSGRLLISTPNALSVTLLLGGLRGENYFPPYDGYSEYARHNRLFSTDELIYLVSKVGYYVHACYSAYDRAYEHPRRLDRLLKLLARRGLLKKRLDVIYLLATPYGKAKYAYPSDRPHRIYQDVHGYRQVVSSRIAMADEESAQLVDGFYQLEDWGGGVRWTAPEARLFLRNEGCQQINLVLFGGPAVRGPLVNGRLMVGDKDHQDETSYPFSIAAGEWANLSFPLPENAPAELLVTLFVDQPLKVPADSRELGIVVREVGLS